MKYKKMICSVSFLFLGLGCLHAQESTVTTGEEATGSGGTVSYSVGQITYTSNSNTNGSVEQGVQQSYKIFVINGVNETAINLQLSVYPNPTTDVLNLTVKNTALESLSYKLTDMHGKVISNSGITSSETNISLENQVEAVYLLNVTEGNKTIKTFKVIKN